MHSYLTSQLARQRHRERQAEQRQAQAVALAAALRRARRARLAPERRVHWAVRKVWWLRSEPER